VGSFTLIESWSGRATFLSPCHWRSVWLGVSCAAPVWDKYKPPFKFTGTLYSATVDVSGELIRDAEAEMRAHMAHQ